MNKKIATFFFCSCIALLVNSTPIDSADSANLSTGSAGQYEVTPLPPGTVPPSLGSHNVREVSNNGKREDLPSIATGTDAPRAVSFISQPVTVPALVAQNITNATVTPVPITLAPTTKIPTTPIPIPTLVPTTSNTTNTTEVPTTTTPIPTTTTVITTSTTTAGTTTSTTTSPTPPTPVTTSGTTTASVTTTPAPAPTAAPSKDRRFDGPSFIGGIVLSLGIMAIAFVAWKFYKARTERNYHTL